MAKETPVTPFKTEKETDLTIALVIKQLKNTNPPESTPAHLQLGEHQMMKILEAEGEEIRGWGLPEVVAGKMEQSEGTG